MISPEDLSLYKLTDNVDDSGGRDPAILPRLSQHAVREEQARAAAHAAADARIARRDQRQFRDILTGGNFEVSGALPEERGEPALVALPRLVFRFNRRNLGRLRQLIDCFNRGYVEAK